MVETLTLSFSSMERWLRNLILQDAWIEAEPGMIECCNEHDMCYDTCNADKDECDFRFKKCLYAVCKG